MGHPQRYRRQLPSSEPMPGVEEGPIEPGARQGAQLPDGKRKPERAIELWDEHRPDDDLQVQS